MRIFRWLLVLLGVSLLCVASSWMYTTVQLNIAQVKGVYSSPEQGMIARAVQNYPAGRKDHEFIMVFVVAGARRARSVQTLIKKDHE